MEFNRQLLAEFIGEVLGTFVLLFLGTGSSICSSVLTQQSDWFQLCAGWGAAVFFGILVSIKLSGAHLNLAVSIALASLRKFDYRKIPVYFLGQLIGAIAGSGMSYLLYYSTIHSSQNRIYIWETYKNDLTTVAEAFFNEFVLTGILLLVILTVTDEYICGKVTTLKISSLVGLTVFIIGVSFGKNTGFAINPSRDLGARIVSLIVNGRDVFTRKQYYFWIPLVAPILGATIFSQVYVHGIRPLMTSETQIEEEKSDKVAA